MYDSFNEGVFSSKSLTIRLYGCKALIVRGDALGYKTLITLIEQACQDEKSGEEFTDLFGKAITKPLSTAITKSNGFNHIFRLHQQKLFN